MPADADTPSNANNSSLNDQVRALVEQGRSDEAIAALRLKLEETPTDAAVHQSLGFTLARQGKLVEAEHHFRQALEQQPDSIDTLRNLALALSQQGKHRDVIGISMRLIALRPEVATYWHELGRVHRRLKQHDAAIAAFKKAIELKPDLADAYHDLGLSLTDRNDIVEAELAYRKSLELKPDFAEALNNLGVLLEGQGRVDEAIDLLRKAVEIRPAPDMWNNLGVALTAKRDFEEGIRCYRTALRMDPNYAAALNNLGNAQRSIGELDDAIVSLRQALRLRPDYAEAYNNLAIALVQTGRHREAIRYYNQAIHFRPDYSEAHMNRSLDRLGLGDFESGWIEYEWRFRGKQLRLRYADRPRWDGSSPAGKRILIHYEQGLGDTIQFIRYAKLLKQLGAIVIAEVQKPLIPLLKTSRYIDELTFTGGEPPRFDFHAPLLSLPGFLGTTLATIPAEVPYLEPDRDLVARWAERLAELPGCKIGIGWQGNPEYRGDRHRSIPLKHFAAIAQVPGVTLISLQKGHGTEQIADVAGLFDVQTFADMDTESGPFMDTAAIMKNLDLVITSDTALPHLAGALGVPVWVALPIACDWRWMHGRDDSPWYPTMRLFRQRETDNWDEVFEQIAIALRQRRADVLATNVEPSPEERQNAELRWREGFELIRQNKLDEAEQKLLHAVRCDPRNAKIHHDLGVVRGKQKRPHRAVASFRRALELAPEVASTWGNLGLAFLETDQVDEAISHLQRALTLGPNAPETFNNLGVAYMRQSRPALAAENYQRALRLRPDYPEAHLNLARALLIQGDFEQGWLEYEWRWKCPGYHAREDDRPRWGGEPLAERTILLHAEQGLGDTFQFVRFARLVKQYGGTVLLECQRAAAALVSKCPGVDQVIPQGSPLPRYDVHAPLMSLPSLLGVTLSALPAKCPYLHANSNLVRDWKEKLRSIQGYNVGVAWQGNPEYDGDRNRSLELKRFAILSRLNGVRLVNLQKGHGSEQLADLDRGVSLIDFGPNVDGANGPFMDTAAIMMSLDLVITSDTAIAHLAGALGVPVWLLLPTAADFRWLTHREDSPWYPTMRLFRQRVRGDWDEVMERVAAALHDRVVSAASVPAPTLAAEIEANGLQQEARQKILAGEFRAAVSLLQRALLADPDCTGAHLDLGVAFARLRDFERAIAHLRRATELAPDRAAGFGNLGLALLESGAADEAVAALRTGLELEPESVAFYKHLGLAYLQLGRTDEGLRSLREAVRLAPHSTDLHVELGNAQRSAGHFMEAAASYRQALILSPDHVDARQHLESLAQNPPAIGSALPEDGSAANPQ